MNTFKRAEYEINKIFNWCENEDFDDVDINGQELIIKITQGIFQVNFHGVTQQIWVSSPITGAHHFELSNDNWVSTRCCTKNLWDLIESDLSQK